MTIRPVPASVPWLSIRTRLERVPGLSEEYQDRICFTRSLKAIGCLPHLGSLQKRMARLAETAGGSTAGHNLRAEVFLSRSSVQPPSAARCPSADRPLEQRRGSLRPSGRER